MRATPPVMASRLILSVRIKTPQAHNVANISIQVAKNKQPKSNLLLARIYGICKVFKLVLQRAEKYTKEAKKKTNFACSI